MGFKEKGGPSGLGPYSETAYRELDIGDYRTRFPAQTEPLTDEQLFHAVSNQDDDMSDDEWAAVFKQAAE